MFLQHRIGLLIVQPVWPRVAEQSTVFNLNDVETLLLTFYRGQARVTRRIVLVRFDLFKFNPNPTYLFIPKNLKIGEKSKCVNTYFVLLGFGVNGEFFLFIILSFLFCYDFKIKAVIN